MKHSNATQQMDILNKEIIQQTFYKLLPQYAFKNPVMACVWVGTILTIIATLMGSTSFGFGLLLSLILLVTVLFANYAEAVAEAKGRGQAASLRQARENLTANRILDLNAVPNTISANLLKKDDLVIVKAGEIVPADGEIIQGFATINESAVTGESAPVLREANTDRSGVIGGTKVLSDEIIIRVSNEAGHSFLDRMIALVEGANRQKTPNEIALSILLNIMTITFIVVVLTLPVIGSMIGIKISIVLLIALLVCLIPTTIGGLLPAIGIAGMNRALKANVLAKSGKAVEVAGDIDVLLLDKTGTITYGDRQATAFYPLAGVTPSELRQAAMLTSFADPTPEGKSVVSLGKEMGESIREPQDAEFIQFSASTRLSGVDLATGQKIRKGAVDAILKFTHQDIKDNVELKTRVEQVASKGATPLVVASNHSILGVIELSDVIKQGIKERFALLREMGIKTIMVTGDNPLTAAAIAAEAGVDDYIAEARPEDKLACIRKEQAAGKLVAMVGDGTNDAPALAQADIGLAMNSGTQAAKEAGNMVDLDSDPTKLLDVVEIGKQQLITRGALTTFSLANDVSKYFVILPALFAVAIPQLGVLNILQLSSPSSAVISALIFNALIIPMLIPLALKGVQFKPASALQLLRRNMLIYGVGGVIFPFIAIKLIDLIVSLWI
ncbi:potassium-transporting ATPase subunit KdpB [Acinetobacter modestus]|uniref:Potassium-transporting ATPase ATP-binding subunit n=1 Tax=Acinetobacter modestus TaxID=1776740 RepID=A0ABP2TT47_9GAMM|nr:potassium-transporting ATPase subunit KdpB [Acinetobacter modestus]ENU25481.1 potassium-transporting ATPase B chain [Acinetobacter modestus]GGA23861.1 potassium-transporting ATPase ATP-binding subunit [Acinetobacter modestus]